MSPVETIRAAEYAAYRHGQREPVTRAQACALLAARYAEQCDRFPMMREIPLALYLARNVPTLMRNRNA